jgi:hypothetical protein
VEEEEEDKNNSIVIISWLFVFIYFIL